MAGLKLMVKLESTSKVKASLRLMVELESTYKLSGTPKVKADLRLVVKSLHQPLPWAARVKLSLCSRTQCPSVFGRRTGPVMPSTTTAKTSHSSVNHRS